MFQIIVYIVLAGLAFTAIHMFDLSRQNIGAAKQLAADKPIIEACKVDRDTAVKANASLQGDIERIGGERDKQSAAVKELSEKMQKQQADKVARLAAAKPRIDALRAESLTLEQRLAANSQGSTCDEKLQNIDRDLRAIIGGVRELPTAAPGSDANKDTSARARAGKGTLRLSQ